MLKSYIDEGVFSLCNAVFNTDTIHKIPAKYLMVLFVSVQNITRWLCIKTSRTKLGLLSLFKPGFTGQV